MNDERESGQRERGLRGKEKRRNKARNGEKMKIFQLRL